MGTQLETVDLTVDSVLNSTVLPKEEEDTGKWSISNRVCLRAKTLPDASPAIGRIQPFSKTAVTFEPMHCNDAVLIFFEI